jgi:hypothetical protein
VLLGSAKQALAGPIEGGRQEFGGRALTATIDDQLAPWRAEFESGPDHPFVKIAVTIHSGAFPKHFVNGGRHPGLHNLSSPFKQWRGFTITIAVERIRNYLAKNTPDRFLCFGACQFFTFCHDFKSFGVFQTKFRFTLTPKVSHAKALTVKRGIAAPWYFPA